MLTAESTERRLAQRECVARGLRSRDEARVSCEYVDASAVLGRLEGMLETGQEDWRMTCHVRLTRSVEADVPRRAGARPSAYTHGMGAYVMGGGVV
ncbi:hypothetical protein [Azoarcus sp. DD4]|uniref:hypothetical protein n=1 Tax=Azoarcus sp. DD4 TaxID=2027405 RepID=UPI00112D2991|nr:hypothetical protein [Azoarcus sp. DD4]